MYQVTKWFSYIFLYIISTLFKFQPLLSYINVIDLNVFLESDYMGHLNHDSGNVASGVFHHGSTVPGVFVLVWWTFSLEGLKCVNLLISLLQTYILTFSWPFTWDIQNIPISHHDISNSNNKVVNLSSTLFSICVLCNLSLLKGR